MGDLVWLALLMLTVTLEPIWRERVFMHLFFSNCQKVNMCTLTPQQLPPSRVSSLIGPPVTGAGKSITFSRLSNESASNHASPGTLAASLLEHQPNDFQEPEFVPFGTLSTVAPTVGSTIPDIRHKIKIVVRFLSTLSDMMELDEPSVSTWKFY